MEKSLSAEVVPRQRLLIGERVEVRQREKGLRGSWHSAAVVKVKNRGRRVVEYDELLSKSGKKKLRESIHIVSPRAREEEVRVLHRPEAVVQRSGRTMHGFIRPIPPQFEPGFESEWRKGLCVDAFVEDAWWEGVLLEDMGPKKNMRKRKKEELDEENRDYARVLFPDEGDEQSVAMESLRITQDWNESTGKWTVRGLCLVPVSDLRTLIGFWRKGRRNGRFDVSKDHSFFSNNFKHNVNPENPFSVSFHGSFCGYRRPGRLHTLQNIPQPNSPMRLPSSGLIYSKLLTAFKFFGRKPAESKSVDQDDLVSGRKATESKSVDQDDDLVSGRKTVESKSGDQDDLFVSGRKTAESKSVDQDDLLVSGRKPAESKSKSVDQDHLLVSGRKPAMEESVDQDDLLVSSRKPAESKSVDQDDLSASGRKPAKSQSKSVDQDHLLVSCRNPVMAKNIDRNHLLVSSVEEQYQSPVEKHLSRCTDTKEKAYCKPSRKRKSAVLTEENLENSAEGLTDLENRLTNTVSNGRKTGMPKNVDRDHLVVPSVHEQYHGSIYTKEKAYSRPCTRSKSSVLTNKDLENSVGGLADYKKSQTNVISNGRKTAVSKNVDRDHLLVPSVHEQNQGPVESQHNGSADTIEKAYCKPTTRSKSAALTNKDIENSAGGVTDYKKSQFYTMSNGRKTLMSKNVDEDHLLVASDHEQYQGPVENHPNESVNIKEKACCKPCTRSKSAVLTNKDLENPAEGLSDYTKSQTSNILNGRKTVMSKNVDRGHHLVSSVHEQNQGPVENHPNGSADTIEKAYCKPCTRRKSAVLTIKDLENSAGGLTDYKKSQTNTTSNGRLTMTLKNVDRGHLIPSVLEQNQGPVENHPNGSAGTKEKAYCKPCTRSTSAVLTDKDLENSARGLTDYKKMQTNTTSNGRQAMTSKNIDRDHLPVSFVLEQNEAPVENHPNGSADTIEKAYCKPCTRSKSAVLTEKDLENSAKGLTGNKKSQTDNILNGRMIAMAKKVDQDVVVPSAQEQFQGPVENHLNESADIIQKSYRKLPTRRKSSVLTDEDLENCAEGLPDYENGQTNDVSNGRKTTKSKNNDQDLLLVSSVQKPNQWPVENHLSESSDIIQKLNCKPPMKRESTYGDLVENSAKGLIDSVPRIKKNRLAIASTQDEADIVGKKGKKKKVKELNLQLSNEIGQKRSKTVSKRACVLKGNKPNQANKRVCRVQGIFSILPGTNATEGLHQRKRTILSFLIDLGLIREYERLRYVRRMDGHIMKEGQATRVGVKCMCCGDVFTLSNFEFHAGSKLHRPSANMFLDDGRSLFSCQLEFLASQEECKQKQSFAQKTDIEMKSDGGDDACSACGDGGELLLCDGCPSTFHADCLGLEGIPEGDWFCASCCCGLCSLNYLTGGDCALSSKEGMLFCEQCERRYHHHCLDVKNGFLKLDSINTSSVFCSHICQEIYSGLHRLVGVVNSLENGLSWTLLRSIAEDKGALSSFDVEMAAEHNSKLSVALAVMQECFVPMVDPQTKIDTFSQIIYNRRSKVDRLNYAGFYTIILEREDEIISVATIRVHGVCLAEMPLIGTRFQYRRQGMCRMLMHCVEMVLKNIGVRKLILPAVPDLLETWINSFGFHPCKQCELMKFGVIFFPGTTFVQKVLDISTSQQGRSDSVCPSIENNSIEKECSDSIAGRCSRFTRSSDLKGSNNEALLYNLSSIGCKRETSENSPHTCFRASRLCRSK